MQQIKTEPYHATNPRVFVPHQELLNLLTDVDETWYERQAA
jgi:hypothetical protein